MAEVYKFVLEDGQEHAWHGDLEALTEAHPGAKITGELVMDEVAQGTWRPTNSHAVAAKRRAEVRAAEREAEKSHAKKVAEAESESKRSHHAKKVVELEPEVPKPTVSESEPAVAVEESV